MKSVQIWSFFWSVFFRIWTEYGKYGPEKSPYLDTFHAVGTIWEKMYHCSSFLIMSTPVDIIVISLEKSSDLIVFFHEMVKIIADFLKY